MNMIQASKRFLPSNYRGIVDEVKDDCLVVKATINGEEITLPAVRMIAGGEFDYVPAVGSEVVIGFIDNKFDQPFIIGSLSGIGCARPSLSKDVVSIDSGDRKIAIKNKNASSKQILQDMNENIIAIKNAIESGLSVSVTLTGTATVGGATMAVIAPVRGTATKQVLLSKYPNDAITKLFT
ncbi:hypothetical protein [Candidatus Borreliella tachyglossi]|uniref:hypothetical protein n=1 Tax=Candidatus Borreliella tachyglossi TaxID=1964448 RepID=UPI0040411585